MVEGSPVVRIRKNEEQEGNHVWLRRAFYSMLEDFYVQASVLESLMDLVLLINESSGIIAVQNCIVLGNMEPYCRLRCVLYQIWSSVDKLSSFSGANVPGVELLPCM